MSDLEFKPGDFTWELPELEAGITSKQMAEKANALLRERLEKAPRVYCSRPHATLMSNWHRTNSEAMTHTARLVMIEELKDG